MAAVAQSLVGRATPMPNYTMPGSDADAEGEEDAEADFEEEETHVISNKQATNSDAEAEVESEEDDNDSAAGTDHDEAVKEPRKRRARVSDNDVAVEDASSDESNSAEEEDESDQESSDQESAVAAQWEAGSEGGEDGSVEVANRNNCVFCGQDEEHDPSEEFEEYMACAVCGDNVFWYFEDYVARLSFEDLPDNLRNKYDYRANGYAAHRQCARDANTLSSDDDTSQWRCPTCVENALEPDDKEDELQKLQRRSSTSKLTKDLLPVHRGGTRAGSHSVFNTLILEDDPLDGSRSLRKRKTSSSENDGSSVDPRKRQRTQETNGSRSGPSRSPVPSDIRSTAIVEEDAPAAEGHDDVASTSTRKSRPSRARRPTVDARRAKILMQSGRMMLKVQLDPRRLKSIIATQPPKKRKRPPRPSTHAPIETEPESARPMPSFTQYSTPFYSFHQSENDELKSKPYGGILSETEANTEKTLPLAADRARFNDARQKAEDEWKQKTASEGETEHRGRSQK
ncbi:MAG: hypothetical protein Q9174_006975, partial [Haloplaca sp. 1 TL-2023]